LGDAKQIKFIVETCELLWPAKDNTFSNFHSNLSPFMQQWTGPGSKLNSNPHFPRGFAASDGITALFVHWCKSVLNFQLRSLSSIFIGCSKIMYLMLFGDASKISLC